jgi:hypothetical protein
MKHIFAFTLNKTRKLSFVYLVLLFGLLSLNSCMKYQYASFGGQLLNEENDLVYENDSLKISYHFFGDNIPVEVVVFNKLSQPLYVDWSKSALIIKDQRFAYFNDNAQFTAQTTGVQVQRRGRVTSEYSSTQGTIYRDEKISFVPPKSKIVYSTLLVQPTWIKSDLKAEKTDVITNFGSNNGKKIVYSEFDSPLNFRSFLTIYSDESMTKARYFDHSFYLKETVETKTNPNELLNRMSNMGYNSKLTGFGGFLGGLFLVGVVLTSIAVGE